MAYQRKTKDVWVIETNYGYGWEEESRYDTWAELQTDIHEYRVCVWHNGGICRIRKRREMIV